MPSLFPGPQHKGSREQGLGQEVGVKAPCPPALWGGVAAAVPLGLNIVLSVMGPQCDAASLASPCLLVHSFIQCSLTDRRSGPGPCSDVSQPSFTPVGLPGQGRGGSHWTMRHERFWRPGAASHHSQVTMEGSWHESSFKKLKLLFPSFPSFYFLPDLNFCSFSCCLIH